MTYEIQYARLATTEKLPDRFLNTQVKESTDLSKSSMGQIFSLIEILTPWFPTAQIGQTIINTFIQNYYTGGSTSDLANFEASLKKVNESLAQITQNGETDWIGNLNGILGVVVENKLHLAQTGKSEAYIFREGKVNHLTYGLAQNGAEPHPLKTFSNITSGELKSLDKILIANPELYKHLTIESLRQIVTLNNPNEVILQIAKILKKKKVNTVNVLIISLLNAEEIAKQEVMPEEETTIYLDRPLESIWAQVTRVWQQIFFPILKFIGKSGQKAGDKSIAFTKNYLTKLKERKTAQEPIKKRDLFEKEFLEANREEGLLKDEEIQYSPELKVHYYEEQKKLKENKFIPFIKSVNVQTKKIFNFIISLAKNRRTRPYFFVGIAIIILIILGLFINSQRHKSGSQFNLTESQQTLREAEEAEKNAKIAILSNDQEKAKLLFTEAIEKAQKIIDFPIVGANAKEILARVYLELDKLTATTRFGSLSPILSTGDDIKSLFIIGGQAYLVTKSDIYRGLLSGGKPEKLISIPKNGGDFQCGFLMNKNIYLYTSSQKVYGFQAENQKIDLVKLENGSWETANACASYIGNLYLLDGIIGQIYKHASSQDIFSKGEPYINTASIDIKNSNSLAIDGYLYVLRNNGDVLKFQRGRLQDFDLKDIPTPWSKIEKPIKIFTDENTPSIYILDGGQKRILEFDKDGHFIHQYALPDSFQDLKDFVVSVKSKKIWVVNKGELYEINI